MNFSLPNMASLKKFMLMLDLDSIDPRFKKLGLTIESIEVDLEDDSQSDLTPIIVQENLLECDHMPRTLKFFSSQGEDLSWALQVLTQVRSNFFQYTKNISGCCREWYRALASRSNLAGPR